MDRHRPDGRFMSLMEEHRHVGFASSQGSDYSKLGEYIWENTKLTALRDLHRGFELGPIDS